MISATHEPDFSSLAELDNSVLIMIDETDVFIANRFCKVSHRACKLEGFVLLRKHSIWLFSATLSEYHQKALESFKREKVKVIKARPMRCLVRQTSDISQ
mmetsp:Transcript_31085/g.41194  ORF Transcript_31085/g.41194 Transcript_31085/m.41194 type:complete len:100 (+) Transcript_31085:1434-1733(+)